MPPTESIILSPSQLRAVDKAYEWVQARKAGHARTQHFPDFFSIGGYAGTGKTTLLKFLLQKLQHAGEIVGVCAFTGKAASVLQSKGVQRATTIHRKVYRWDEGERKFYRKKPIEFPYSVLIIDEASMVPNEIFEDIRMFNPAIIAIGDPGQLPPVSKSDLNLVEDPDVMLTEIHRQAADNPIVRLSKEIREYQGGPTGTNLPFSSQNDLGDEVVIADEVEDVEERFWTADVIITSTNKARWSLNEMKRSLLDFDSTFCLGERIIFLQNNEDLKVYNGLTATIQDYVQIGRDKYEADLLFDDGTSRTVPITSAFIGRKTDDFKELRRYRDYGIIDYGYALTCHKSQGSEYDSVAVYRIPLSFDGWDQPRWDYTAVTRAAKRLTIVCA